MDFLNSFKSINWVNFATYASVVITLIIFFYQEFSSRIEGKKEVKRIVEEIVDLVIRNAAGKKIGLTEIDLEFIIAGFESLKKIKLAIPKSSFLKMIYAKVYTNEHITTEIRISILRSLDDKINEAESNEIVTEMENKARIDWKRKNEILASIICLLLLTFSYKYILVFEYLKDDILLTFVLIFCILVFVIYWLKPTLSNLLKEITEKQLTKQIERIKRANFEVDDSEVNDNEAVEFRTLEKGNTKGEIAESGDIKELKPDDVSIKNKPNEDVKIKPAEKMFKEENSKRSEDLMSRYLPYTYSSDNIDLIKNTLEHRFIFERILDEINLKVYGRRSKLPVIKVLNRLYNDKILNAETFNEARQLYSFANRIIHGDLMTTGTFSDYFLDLINTLYSLKQNLTNEEIEAIRKRGEDEK